MADTHVADPHASETAAADAWPARLSANESARVEGTRGSAEEAPAESSTRGILRDAIQKVMDEIAHHEREARNHLQQAAALRKDLSDSFAFLQERGERRKPGEAMAESQTGKAPENEPKAKSKETTPPGTRTGPKPKPVSRKGKKG